MRTLAAVARLLLPALVFALVLGACGSSGSSDSNPKASTPVTAGGPSTTAPARTAQLETYCVYARRFQDLTARIDRSSAAGWITGLAAAAEVERAWGETAPPQLAAAHRVLTAAATELVARLRASAPKTLAEFQAAANDANAALDRKYPDLRHASGVVQTYAESNCGLARG